MPFPKTLLLFGPAPANLNETYFRKIVSLIKEDTCSRWAIEAVEDVVTCWDSICESVPKLNQTPGLNHAQRLNTWLRTGDTTPTTDIPNAILASLVVIAQLVEYLRYLDETLPSGLENGRGFTAPLPAQVEAVGCCLGVFSALVVSSSSSWAQWSHNAAAVVRTVFVLGALSDAQDAVDSAGTSTSLIATWRRGQDLKKSLDRFPEAYASIFHDDSRATVTVPTRMAAALSTHLQTAGFTVEHTEHRGKFHAGDLYGSDLDAWFSFARTQPTFQLPAASCLVIPVRINSEKVISGTDNLLETAARALLVQKFDWTKTFRSVASDALRDRASRVIEFGPEKCVPPTLLRRLSGQVTQFQTREAEKIDDAPTSADGVREDDIAVIGMACNVAGAQDIGSYWKILLEGKSQHREIVPDDRFTLETEYRSSDDSDGRKWFGNFIEDHDAFDHKFFKKTPREALHMDPQQRLLLQTAYQAVSQSGYYHKSGMDNRIGCYVGLVSCDYQDNIAQTAPNAFSATGTLRGFVAGKVGHFFGWTGPAMTVDTACSASTVAMDLAVKAIRNGECSAALVGGTSVFSSPMFLQNLAAGSFLSATGQCKPFDEKADGYCRGEAIGAILVKKLSSAIHDGDQILGVISATAVNQNDNSTPIFVPNSPSLTKLFQTVISQAGVEAKDISVVEAHGTGTAVGDPVEYDSIRQVLGGAARGDGNTLQLGSVKGLVGHTEGASGVVSLIKLLLMLQESKIPPQPSFDVVNPAIKHLPSDRIEISKAPMPWKGRSRVALLNNYGAAGNNASIVIKETPKLLVDRARDDTLTSSSSTSRLPLFVTGLDDASIQAFTARLRHFIRSKEVSGSRLGIENLVFNVNRQSNWSLSRGLVLTSDSVEDLDRKLATPETFVIPAARPVILCFGGQVARFVGLDRALYDRAAILRHHLDSCDRVCKSIGAGSIYPAIFQREPINDPALLQPLLFAMQYASALSWIDAGVEPAALVGHSFGELTAICVAGVLSLEDALKMVHGRSQVIRDAWGSEKGSMIAIEADLADVESLLAVTNRTLKQSGRADRSNIACYNGSRSFTLAGSVAAIDTLQMEISKRNISLPALKHKRLDVTNAFHSSLVEHLKPELQSIGRKLNFKQPSIPIERATEKREGELLSISYVAEHMKQPVYFNHAVQRLSKQYPAAIFLEAGSNSTITSMANKALGMPKSSVFQSVDITSANPALQQLADATANLWKAGLRVNFWLHARMQTYEYAPVLLPPYQFEKQRHWLEFKPPQKQEVIQLEKTVEEGLFTVLSSEESNSMFRINTEVKQFVDTVSGYVFAKTSATAPVTFQLDIAIQALMSVRMELSDTSKWYPEIHNVTDRAALFHSPSRVVLLKFERLSSSEDWGFEFTSNSAGADEATHVTGQLCFRTISAACSRLDFGRLERLVPYERALRALNGQNAEDVIQGPTVYKLFSHVVELGEQFGGVKKIVGRRNESAGSVVRRRPNESWLDSSLAETFGLIGQIWVNCMAQSPALTNDTVFVPTGFEQWMRSPDLLRKLGEATPQERESEWHVLAQHQSVQSEFITDLFVFDAASGSLEEVILGIRYTSVQITQVLTGAGTPTRPVILSGPAQQIHTTAPAAAAIDASIPRGTQVSETIPALKSSQVAPPPYAEKQERSRPRKDIKSELWAKLRPILAEISGLEPDEIDRSDSLADIGIDSLVGMELTREVERKFNCSFDKSKLFTIVDVPGLIDFIQSTLGLDDGHDGGSETDPASSGVIFSEGSSTTSDSTASFEMIADDLDVTTGSCTPNLELHPSVILGAFRESKHQIDHLLKTSGVAGYMDGIAQKQTRLCIVLISRALKKLGCDLAVAKPGDVLKPVPCVPQHQRFHKHLYHILEESRIIDIEGGVVRRTSIPLPSQSAEAIVEDLTQHHTGDSASHKLTYNVGSHMAEVLSGEADGPTLIFGDAKNREHVAEFYGGWPLNKLFFEQMAAILGRVAAGMAPNTTLKILEMGAGTGGTTKMLVPYLAKLGIPVEYTFTDLSPSLVGQAKRKFKQYPFMKFAVHDIEKPPPDGTLTGTQHIVVASNAVHATHSLNVSTTNIRKFLRPDGFLMLLEMMRTLPWVDVVWGTLEGWWLFDDGREHAINDEVLWRKELLRAGYKHVEWTEGKLPENGIQKILIALAADAGEAAICPPPALRHDAPGPTPQEIQARNSKADEHVKNAARDFCIPNYSGPLNTSTAKCVLLTGATGSLGSHILERLVKLSSIDAIYCLNRNGGPSRGIKAAQYDPRRRQLEALVSKGINLDADLLAKLHVIETDSSRPRLGLDAERYEELVLAVTHIVHNGFPVNGLRSLEQNEPQFATMRNLVDLAAAVSARRHPTDFRFTFQFVSSLSAVGNFPVTHPGQSTVPEQQFNVDSALPNGYGAAKVICERILQATVGSNPARFRAHTVRLGQISGSEKTGYWNQMEMLSFLFKSAQTLRTLPDVRGALTWLSLEQATMPLADLLLSPSKAGEASIYHVENPDRRDWADAIPVWASALGVPREGIVPLSEWLRCVRAYPGESVWDNPAYQAIDFYEDKFEMMSCGGVLLDTTNALRDSHSLRNCRAIGDDVIGRYVDAWRKTGFLR